MASVAEVGLRKRREVFPVFPQRLPAIIAIGFAGLAIAGLFAGCSVYDRNLIKGISDAAEDSGPVSGDSGPVDARVLDAGPGDAVADGVVPEEAAVDAGECVPSPEVCDGKDNDCDGQTDEAKAADSCKLINASAKCEKGKCQVDKCAQGFGDCDGEPETGCETQLNVADHCGSCGNNCADLSNIATVSCKNGECFIGKCIKGYDDCNGIAGDGCETPLNTMTDCGACDNSCPGESCATGVCVAKCDIEGYGDCDGDVTNGCETPLNTLSNCGDCHVTCEFPNAWASCETGECEFIKCKNGYADCDSDESNGCEKRLGTVTDCGSCGDKCEYTNAWASCVSETCQFVKCKDRYADCDGDSDHSCETSLTTLTDCGACGVSCSETSCAGGVCTIMSCAKGTADCDSDGTTCETPLTTSDNCAICHNPCALDNATASCWTGNCEIDSCAAGYGDCDGQPYNGCEANLAADVNNCGGCGNNCEQPNSSAVCQAGECRIFACADGYADCDGKPENGCETQITTATDCGGCGVNCEFLNAYAGCATGTCEFIECKFGYDDCDNNAANGCETDLTTKTDCGACGAACSKSSCAGGVCTMMSCAKGTADCDGDGASCETTLTTLTDCAICGNTCALDNATASCGSGECEIESCKEGYYDCNGEPFDGCEASLTTVANCGVCGRSCGPYANAEATCDKGSCVMTCHDGWGDCSGGRGDGCESELNTAEHCGGCDNACGPYANAEANCDKGSCAMTCKDGWADCNTNENDGCETELNTAAHCKDCNDVCSAPPNATAGCSNGVCGIGECNPGYGDCTADPGCETQLGTPTNCEACGDTCEGRDHIKTGSCGGLSGCAIAACDSGYFDCNGSGTDGCEAQLGTAAHCSDCDDVCYAPPHTNPECNAGSCEVGGCVSGWGDCTAAEGCETQLGTATHCKSCNDSCVGLPNVKTASCGGISTGCVIGSCESGYLDSDGNAANGCESNMPIFSFTPSNFIPADVASGYSASAVTLDCGVSTFNSQTLTYGNWCGQAEPTPVVKSQTGGPDVVIIGLQSLTVASGATLQLSGNRPVIFAVFGDANIAGTVDASAAGNTAGPGGNVNCAGSTGPDGIDDTDSHDGSSGGGGGGFGLAGAGSGAGNQGAAGVAGGAAIGNAALVPLRGGCSGGKGGGAPNTGGGGGGAVQISASGALTVTGTVAAAGSGGLRGDTVEDGGGGGGGGGAILLEGGTVSINSSAKITANGGGGGSGNDASSVDGNNGSDGSKTATSQASGGAGDNAGDGGKGGASAGAATKGGDGQCEQNIVAGCFWGAGIYGAGGGGGGGGVGRIRLNSASSCSNSGTYSPSASLGGC